MTIVNRLENTSWDFVAFVSAGRSTPLAPGTEITLTFAAMDGTLQLAGSGGCNRYFAPCTLSGQEISVGLIGATKMMGPDPAMAQETRYFRALEMAQRWEIQGDGLVIGTREGELRFARSAP